jgi:hypothetical protein
LGRSLPAPPKYSVGFFAAAFFLAAGRFAADFFAAGRFFADFFAAGRFIADFFVEAFLAVPMPSPQNHICVNSAETRHAMPATKQAQHAP